ncbi:DUF4954 family protein [candidate division KSB1 bacterium]|nr:DUF4954 family protein [candidate division KSB1 bacterium]
MADVKRTPLDERAITILKRNGCKAEDWNKIYISGQFDPELVAHTEFRGTVLIGTLIAMDDRGATPEVGIKNATLENVQLGDGCSIHNVHVRLKNLKIGSRVKIWNVGDIRCDRKTSFGNGHVIDVLNEAGGRQLPITCITSSQIAYLSVFYRHDNTLIRKLDQLASDYSAKVTDDYGTIGDDVVIQNTKLIVNVNIGPGAHIINVTSLKEGTIDSSLEASTLIEDDVIAENFIVQKGARITAGALLSSTLVGEAAKIGKQFSAENSLFFANSEGYHSEICSVFGGPYTVTHHRSTLLIANFCSFYNAGSGTNQSNHMYKLGPVHQGIMERGCKTGSFSYLLWPSRIGAFSVVLGKHFTNFDSTFLPFSYINEEEGKSFMFPGYNIFTVGTYRDEIKWRKRDRRKNVDKLDLIIYDIFSPYIALRLMKGIEIATELQEKSDKKQEFVIYNGLRIKRLLLNSCIKHFNLGLDRYFGSILIRRIQGANSSTLKESLKSTQQVNETGEEWLDVSGLICRRDRLNDLITKLHQDQVDSLESLNKELKKIYDTYAEDEWNWYCMLYKKQTGKNIWEEDKNILLQIIEKWKDASLKINNLILKDAKWEFDTKTHIGFGIDGQAGEDFIAVRGEYDTNSVIQQINQESAEIENTYESIRSKIE